MPTAGWIDPFPDRFPASWRSQLPFLPSAVIKGLAVMPIVGTFIVARPTAEEAVAQQDRDGRHAGGQQVRFAINMFIIIAALGFSSCSPGVDRFISKLGPAKPKPPQPTTEDYERMAMEAMVAYRHAALVAVDRYSKTAATPDDIVDASMVASHGERDAYHAASLDWFASQRRINNPERCAGQLVSWYSNELAKICKKRVLDRMVDGLENPADEGAVIFPPVGFQPIDDAKRM